MTTTIMHVSKPIEVTYAKMTEAYTHFLQYRPALRKYFTKVTTVILLNQLERWFAHKPNIFYKFLAPCQHELYRVGDSWEEELGFSAPEFRSAFDELGIRYASKREVLHAIDTGSDPFQGKYYLSYKDVRRGLTFYLRHDQAVNGLFKQMLQSSQASDSNAACEDEEKPRTPTCTLPEQWHGLKALILSTQSGACLDLKKSLSGQMLFRDRDCQPNEINVPEIHSVNPRSAMSSSPYNEQENTATKTSTITAAITIGVDRPRGGHQKNAAVFSFPDNQEIVNGKLNASQVAQVNQFITTHAQRLTHLGDSAVITQALIADLEDPVLPTRGMIFIKNLTR